MKSLIRSVLLVLSVQTFAFPSANIAWQQARIVEVRNTTNDRTTSRVVNTPIVDEEKICEITIHLGTRIVRGSYTLGKTQAAPPPEWIQHAPVRAQLVGDTLFLKALTGEQYRLRVESNGPGAATDPWTADELAAERNARAEQEQETKSLVGLDEPKAPAKSAPVAADPTTGTISVSSTPSLADLYVDGENLGYTPAKIKLVPGKHTFRCEEQGFKPWTKEITLTTGSGLTLDATLEPK